MVPQLVRLLGLFSIVLVHLGGDWGMLGVYVSRFCVLLWWRQGVDRRIGVPHSIDVVLCRPTVRKLETVRAVDAASARFPMDASEIARAPPAASCRVTASLCSGRGRIPPAVHSCWRSPVAVRLPSGSGPVLTCRHPGTGQHQHWRALEQSHLLPRGRGERTHIVYRSVIRGAGPIDLTVLDATSD